MNSLTTCKVAIVATTFLLGASSKYPESLDSRQTLRNPDALVDAVRNLERYVGIEGSADPDSITFRTTGAGGSSGILVRQNTATFALDSTDIATVYTDAAAGTYGTPAAGARVEIELSRGYYTLSDQLVMSGAYVDLLCNGATITGTYEGNLIDQTADNVRLDGCTIINDDTNADSAAFNQDGETVTPENSEATDCVFIGGYSGNGAPTGTGYGVTDGAGTFRNCQFKGYVGLLQCGGIESATSFSCQVIDSESTYLVDGIYAVQHYSIVHDFVCHGQSNSAAGNDCIGYVGDTPVDEPTGTPIVSNVTADVRARFAVGINKGTVSGLNLRQRGTDFEDETIGPVLQITGGTVTNFAVFTEVEMVPASGLSTKNNNGAVSLDSGVMANGYIVANADGADALNSIIGGGIVSGVVARATGGVLDRIADQTPAAIRTLSESSIVRDSDLESTIGSAVLIWNSGDLINCRGLSSAASTPTVVGATAGAKSIRGGSYEATGATAAAISGSVTFDLSGVPHLEGTSAISGPTLTETGGGDAGDTYTTN